MDLHTEVLNTVEDRELLTQTVFHEAGYATAIYLRNRENNLPPVHFQIIRRGLFTSPDYHNPSENQTVKKNYVQVEGGRLIDPLSISMSDCVNNFSSADKEAFKIAFEADIINLLAGSFAEVKYVTLRDKKLLNLHPVSFNAMNYYCESYSYECTREYLECFFKEAQLRKNKIAELFAQSFKFVNDKSNWKAIRTLADYLLSHREAVITCEEAINVLVYSNIPESVTSM